MIVTAEEFFSTVQPGQRFRLVDPTEMSMIPGPRDVLTAVGMQPDEEIGEVWTYRYDNGMVGCFEVADMTKRGMKFDLLEER